MQKLRHELLRLKEIQVISCSYICNNNGDFDHHICSVEGDLLGDNHLWVELHTSNGVISESVHTEK